MGIPPGLSKYLVCTSVGWFTGGRAAGHSRDCKSRVGMEKKHLFSPPVHSWYVIGQKPQPDPTTELLQVWECGRGAQPARGILEAMREGVPAEGKQGESQP